MFCKYCKDASHDINDCTKIKCLNCNEKGHPHWKCPLSIKNNNIKKPKKQRKRYKKNIDSQHNKSIHKKFDPSDTTQSWFDLCPSSDDETYVMVSEEAAAGVPGAVSADVPGAVSGCVSGDTSSVS